MSNDKQNYYLNEGIAIIGIGCIYPKASNKDIFWENIINKVDGIRDVPKDRWDVDVYFHEDRNVPDKTYQKIGGFVDEIDSKEISIKYKIPPRTVEAMDRSQRYAILAAGEALIDSGYDEKDFDRERTAVVIGNSMGGDQIDYTNLRAFFGDIEDNLRRCNSFSNLDSSLRAEIIEEFEKRVKGGLPVITEDSMPGELANVISGRIANVFNLRGPSFTVDAACASSMAAFSSSVKGLRTREYDMVITGGSDFLMGPGPYIKFSKIGALSPDGSRPFDAGANGFVMGEGVGLFVLKRVSDARRDGDKIYSVIRGIGASSDGKGKGITAPNPKGQMLAINRAFESAGYAPDTVQYVEAHGTATIVGDVAEVESLCNVWDTNKMKAGSIGIGSVKSMIGHLKAAAGSASIVKVALALHKKKLPPSINYNTPNPNIDFGNIPFRVITKPEDWPAGIDGNPRRANTSAFGFGGTNFHIAMEEDVGDNGMPMEDKRYFTSNFDSTFSERSNVMNTDEHYAKENDKGGYGPALSFDNSNDKRYSLSEPERLKLEGEAIIIGGSSWDDVKAKMDDLRGFFQSKKMDGDEKFSISMKELFTKLNMQSNGADFKLGISAISVADLIGKLDIAEESLYNHKKRIVLKNKGIFYGEELKSKKEKLGKIGFLFPGQGSQYTNMLKDLYSKYKIVKETYDEADEVMQGIIGKKITEIIFIRDDAEDDERREAEEKLKQTEVAQPAILAADVAIYRLLRSFGVSPDVVVGHSLGEYGALVAAGVLDFKDALYAVSARGREIAKVQIDDVGKMASIAINYQKVGDKIKDIDGYVIIANKNCYSQTVIAGDSKTVLKAIDKFSKMGVQAQEIPVSHAFHSQIVAPACDPYRRVLEGLDILSPKIDILANLNADYYPKGDDVREKILDILEKHIANPVEFIDQIERMYNDGVRIFLEIGPKRALTSFVVNIIDKKPHLAVATNHPKRGGVITLNDSLAAIATYGYDIDWNGVTPDGMRMNNPYWRYSDSNFGGDGRVVELSSYRTEASVEFKETRDEERLLTNKNDPRGGDSEKYDIRSDVTNLRRGIEDIAVDSLFSDFQKKQKELVRDVLDNYSKRSEELLYDHLREMLHQKKEMDKYNINLERVMISGISVGLPGLRYSVFGDDAFDRLFDGVNMIDPLTNDEMRTIVDKNIHRLVKSSDGGAHFETIDNLSQVPKLAGKMGKFDFETDYGIDNSFSETLDVVSKLVIAASLEALKDAGIPLVRIYKDTSTGGVLPLHWGLPEYMIDDTGIVFASAFPGYDSLVDEVSRSIAYRYGSKSKRELTELYTSIIQRVDDEKIREELSDWYVNNYSTLNISEGEDGIYKFNRKFILRILAMGHSQLAQFLRVRGPNLQVNTACSSTVTAVGVAEDLIRTGRAKRIILVGADVVTNEFMEWLVSGLFAVGAMSSEGDYRNAAIPFDKRRSGMIAGMGAAGMVIEAESEIRKRGMEPIVELVATEYSNSAFHFSRLDIDHIASVMDRLITKVERVLEIKRSDIAKELTFMSHETYTPARGGSASAEVKSLRSTFGDEWKSIVVSNTKGFTGHAMGAGIEDVCIIRSLQIGKLPPIANYKEPDPELAGLNLSHGGNYDNLKYGLRLGAGFGSQISMSFIRLVSKNEDRIVDRLSYNNWLSSISGIDNPELEIVNRTLRVKEDERILNRKRDLPRVDIPKKRIQEAVVETALEGKNEEVDTVEAIAQSTSPSSMDDVVRSKILGIVSDKTGYPEDLIEFDLDMESDLGIDTVKQAEMFGMIREVFDIPKDEGLKIKDFPTLNHILDYAKGRSSADSGNGGAVVSERVVDSSSSRGDDDAIRSKILGIVSDKTGYPEDLIEFDLDMESDLGIDTVKQAEMFGMIREVFDIPKDEGLKIKDFPTLNHILEFARDRSNGFKTDAIGGSDVEGTISTEANVSDSKIKRIIAEIIDDPLNMDRDGRFNFEGYNIIITDDGKGVAKSLSRVFSENKANVEIIDFNGIETEDELMRRVEEVKRLGKINGFVHLVPLRESKNLTDLSFDEWRQLTFHSVKGLFILTKAIQMDLLDNAGSKSAFVLTATSMGGSFGFEDFQVNEPTSGGVAGLTKALNKELEGVLVKTVDFLIKGKPSSISRTIFNEIQYGDERVEVGYSGKRRVIPQLIFSELNTDVEPRMKFDSESVFLITGGGYGITSEIAKDIAKHFKSRIIIISREGLPSNIEELASLDENGLKELKDRVINELKSTEKRITPVIIDREYGKYLNAIEKYKNIRQMEDIGAASVEYYPCDVSDNEGMSGIINSIKEKYGRIDVIIHGAGIDYGKLLEDKKYKDFCRVFDVKVDGCFNLVELTRDIDVKALVTFSSVSGRFGNRGQTDYSAANDLLNKYVQHVNKRKNGKTVAVSMNWSGWKDVGMATRESITKIFEEDGIDMISLADGVTRVREEILFGHDSEVVIAGKVGILDSDAIVVGDRSKEFLNLVSLVKSKREVYPLLDEIIDFEPGKRLVVKKKLDPEIDIYLKDHSIENVPYFPAVMGIEAFAEVTHLLFPEKRIRSMRDIQFQVPIKLLKGNPVDLIITVEECGTEDGKTELNAKIETEFYNKEGIKLGDNKLHFTARIIISEDKVVLTKSESAAHEQHIIERYMKDGAVEISDEEIYKRFFHGPVFQVHNGVLNLNTDKKRIVGAVGIKNEKIFKSIEKPRFIANPMTIEAALQNAGIYGMANANMSSLPDAITELEFRKIPDKVDSLFILAEHIGNEEDKHIYDTEIFDNDGNLYSRMKGYKMINTEELEENERFQ
ncbi:MAG: SDR family NAD(P)-dependent oxidoreductase [Spirochaetota bacterium]|nr:SDR family NAD(P)-dependent oxidoreductase [Spirochaetota bacterium]